MLQQSNDLSIHPRRRLPVPLLLAIIWSAFLCACHTGMPAISVERGNPTETTASIEGIVTTDGFALPGVTVTVTGGGTSRAAVTDVNGHYRIAFLQPASYRVRMELSGMSPVTHTVTLAASDHAQVRADLKLSSVAEAITVTASSPSMPGPGSYSASASMPFTPSPRRAVTPPAFSQANVAPPQQSLESTAEEYSFVPDNLFQRVHDQPYSTFSIDVDRASYSNSRRFLQNGFLPPKEAVRIEEFVNYFTYDYPESAQGPIGISAEIADCPWETRHRLLRIGLQARHVALDSVPASNFVFLIDVSGSMDSPDKLPLVQQSMHYLADQLRKQDRVAIVVYAGAAGLVLPTTPGDQKALIYSAIDGLAAGGSTAGAEGIVLAYKIAKENFIKGGNNRVVLATDGDFNVGVSSIEELERLITNEKKSGVFLSVIGVGQGNLKDARLESLADKGNGNYSYLDSLNEARKVLADEFAGTMLTIAKDVKVQLFFNPARVAEYRLVGYENRMLAKEDFTNDAKDAGEMGAGHSVTALYELVPPGAETLKPEINRDNDALANGAWDPGHDNDVVHVSIRYKEPASETSQAISQFVADSNASTYAASDGFRIAAAAAEFAMVLRESPSKGSASFADAAALARSASKISAQEGSELVRLVELAEGIHGKAN